MRYPPNAVPRLTPKFGEVFDNYNLGFGPDGQITEKRCRLNWSMQH